MARQPRWREFLRVGAGALGSFLAVMTAAVVSTLLDSVLNDLSRRLAAPEWATLISAIIGIVAGMLVYYIVARTRIKKK